MFKQLSCYLFALLLRSACLPVPFSLASSLILYKRSFHLIQHWESSDENYRKVHEKRVALIPSCFRLSTRTRRTRSKQHLSALGGWLVPAPTHATGHCEGDVEEKSLELLLEWVERSVGWFFWPSCPLLLDQHSWVYWFTGAPRTD